MSIAHLPPPPTDPAPAALTWRRMVEIEPQLLDLRVSSRIASRRGGGTWHEYERHKRNLKRLVGWHAARPELQTSEAYDICHRRILGAWDA